jgi:hypothetical protein
MYQASARYAGATFGDVHIHVTQPHATTEEIHRTVKAAMTSSLERQQKQMHRTMTQFAPTG